MQKALSGYSMGRIALDIIGELPVIERGDRYQGQRIVREL